MMVMRRKEGEKILIGDNIVLHIVQIGRNRVRIGIDAPREMTITAEEVRRLAEVNTAAAATSPHAVLGLVGRLQAAGLCEPGPEHERTSGCVRI